MNYPLELKFKRLTFGDQFTATDANGQNLLYIKQKLFKLKDQVLIYQDSSQQTLLFNLRADKVFDFSPTYHLSSPDGQVIGIIKRNGRRSLWRADYEVSLGDTVIGKVGETNPWTKVFDNLLGAVPFVGPIFDLLGGYFLNPAYAFTSVDGQRLGLLKKEAAFLEGRFSLSGEGLLTFSDEEQQRLIALLSAVVLLERSSG